MGNDLKQAHQLIRCSKETKFPVLYLESCGIKSLNDIPELQECSHLTKLSLNDNSITDITPLVKLPKLEYLKLNSNLVSDVNCLVNLSNLKKLSLSFNNISDISCLEKLIYLEDLDLSQNQIIDISYLSKLMLLETLILRSNKISNIDSLASLSQLKHLDLSSNNISNLSGLSRLKQLTKIDLSYNKIAEIPIDIINLDLEINLSRENYDFRGLNLHKNPIESPPIEILKTDKSAILDWYKASKKKLNEVKIILIGDPKAGKTSLLRRLKDDKFNEAEVQTDGVNIEDIKFGDCKTFKKQRSLHNLTGHFWDFGGQEIMNATHQFFLTNRSIYILLLDARKDSETSGQVRQWIKRIKATSGDSSIIVVANQIDINPSFGFANEYELQNEFPQIKYFIKISCKTSENIPVIKNILEELIPKAELLETIVDEKWILLKERLQKLTKKHSFLNEATFLEICNDIGLNKKQSQQNAIRFLHDLGLVLHFENVDLSEYYVLDPYWITYGVYQVLTSTYASTNKGIISMDKLEYIVNDEIDKQEKYTPVNYKKIIYTNNQRRFLVDILNQFKLCFYLQDRQAFIIPDLLDTIEPYEKTESLRKSHNSIRFVYEYEYLPKSILPYIMVETNLMISEKWRTGCILKYDGFESLISSYQNKITIIVASEQKKKSEFLAVLRHIIDSINKKLTDSPKMLIPLPDVDAYVDYEELLYRVKEGEKNYSIYKPIIKKYEISMLLEGIPTFNEVNEISNKIDKVLANQEGILASIEEIKVIQNGIYKYLIEQPENANIKDEIVNAVQEICFNQKAEITQEIMQWVADAFDILEEDLDDKLKDACYNIKKTDDVKVKLKLAVPFINLIGIKFESELDIKNWCSKMYAKYQVNIFRLMGVI